MHYLPNCVKTYLHIVHDRWCDVGVTLVWRWCGGGGVLVWGCVGCLECGVGMGLVWRCCGGGVVGGWLGGGWQWYDGDGGVMVVCC